jgi:hypothetical protein
MAYDRSVQYCSAHCALHCVVACRPLLLATLQTPVVGGLASQVLRVTTRSEHSKRLLALHDFNAKFR